MNHTTLMVQLELGRSNKAPLGVARDLAGRLDAAVAGIACAQTIQVLMGEEFFGDEILREDQELIERQTKAAEAEFHDAMDGRVERLSWSAATTYWPLSDRIAEAAGPVDLLVVGVAPESGDYSNSTRRLDVDDLIMQAGRPVLVVPLGIEHGDFGCALVAWKDCREARRALSDALPLLGLMDKVVIAAIADRADQEAAEVGLGEMVDWLSRHGVAALPRLVESSGPDGERLLALAEKEGAGLIVAGAYGHSRLREWVLGGVTRALLQDGKHCVLLSH